ncbi:MAG: phosphatidylserine decarboxylase [Clostridiales bacterium]|nr:phosphatidylserine decarboxylase [Clostridiales bacterium]
MNGLEFLYKTAAGRIILRPLVSRPVSVLSGKLMDSKASKVLIRSFAKKNDIRVEDYELDNINCFNDFFCRKIKDGLRPVSDDPLHLISPCDGLLSVYKISSDTVLNVKQSEFTVSGLLKDEALAREFYGGYALVFRLCVNHYHRYIYFDSGRQQENVKIRGIYHTVRPVALEQYPVFIQNTREYAVINSDNFGKAVQMEVGAMLVGRIVNDNPSSCDVTRGEEKGHFEYGGSTIILLIQKDKANIDDRFINSSEVPVVMGQTIGLSA